MTDLVSLLTDLGIPEEAWPKEARPTTAFERYKSKPLAKMVVGSSNGVLNFLVDEIVALQVLPPASFVKGLDSCA